MAQNLRSKNRQKGDQFFYQMSGFCENAILTHIIPPPFGKCLVDNVN